MSVSVFDELTRVELRKRTGDLVVIPLGATEQHGDALPVMTDAAIVTELAARAASIAGVTIDVLLAPTVRVGVSPHHVRFGGTLTLSATTFIAVLVDLVTGLRAQGFRRTLFVNGHGGNDSSMRVAVEMLAASAAPGESAAGLSYWTLADAGASGFPVPGHAGGFETSAMLAVRPDLVRILPDGPIDIRPLATDVVDGVHDVRPDVWAESDGVTDNAAGANPAAGEEAITAIAHRIADAMVDQVRQLDDRAARTARSSPTLKEES